MAGGQGLSLTAVSGTGSACCIARPRGARPTIKVMTGIIGRYPEAKELTSPPPVAGYLSRFVPGLSGFCQAYRECIIGHQVGGVVAKSV